MGRLEDRTETRRRHLWCSHVVVIFLIGLVVLARAITYALTSWHLFVDNIPAYRQVQVAGTAFAVVMDVALVLIVWTLFEMLRRIERESDRLQSFMDNIYRRLP